MTHTNPRRPLISLSFRNAADKLAIKGFTPTKSLPRARDAFRGEPSCQMGWIGIVRSWLEAPVDKFANNARPLLE